MTNTTIRTLPADLTDKEKSELGDRLAKINLRIQDLNNQKINIPKIITALQQEAYDLSKQFREGKTNKEIECYWEYDEPDPGIKSLKRTDTHEVIETDNMTLFDINQGETVFKLLRNNFVTEKDNDPEFIEFSDTEAVAVLNTVISERAANIIVNNLVAEFRNTAENNHKAIIEQGDYPAAKKLIKDVISSFTETEPETIIEDEPENEEEAIPEDQ